MFIVTAAHRCFCVFSIMPIFFSLPELVAAAEMVPVRYEMKQARYGMKQAKSG